MSVIDPVEVKQYDDDVMKRYNLPYDSEPLVLMLDIREEGYDVEWFSAEDLEGFVDTADRLSTESAEVFATFETGCESTFRKRRSSVQEMLSVFDKFYPDECSYFRFEDLPYNIGWEKEGRRNSIVLSVDSDSIDPLYAYVEEFSGLFDSEPVELALSQADEIIQEEF